MNYVRAVSNYRRYAMLNFGILLCVWLVLLPVCDVMAGVGKFYSPKIDKGKFEIEYQLVRVDDDKYNKHNSQKHRVEVEYAPTDDWMLEMGMRFTDTRNQNLRADTIFWEVIRQLTDQDEGWWFSSGIYGEYVRNLSGSPDKLEAKLLLQYDTPQLRNVANVIVEREIGAAADNAMEIGSRIYSMYRMDYYINPAIEWHATWGTNQEIPAFERQKHFVGPAIYGNLFTTGAGAVEYELGYMFGITDAAEDGALRFHIEYETAF